MTTTDDFFRRLADDGNRRDIATGDRDAFRAWLRHKTHTDEQDDALSERLRQHIAQVNQAAADALDRALHPKRPRKE
ncbi:MAG TPA: hypothetical protein VF808_14430 [Ktedonobacterales bacterium]